jgi:hypothetical protein
MTISQAHLEFKIGLDKTDSLNSANFLTEEIDLYLSNAQEQFIENRAYGLNFQNKHLEETQKRVKDLQSITTNANITAFTNNTDNKTDGFFIVLPFDYRHALQEDIDVSYLDCNNKKQTKNIQIIPLQHDKYNKMVVNPFARPSLDKVYRLPFGRFNNQEHFELILASGQTPVTYHLRYLKNPRKIDKAQILSPLGLPGTSPLDMTDEACREIVRLAVRNALGDIESTRLQESVEKIKEIE